MPLERASAFSVVYLRQASDDVQMARIVCAARVGVLHVQTGGGQEPAFPARPPPLQAREAQSAIHENVRFARPRGCRHVAWLRRLQRRRQLNRQHVWKRWQGCRNREALPFFLLPSETRPPMRTLIRLRGVALSSAAKKLRRYR